MTQLSLRSAFILLLATLLAIVLLGYEASVSRIFLNLGMIQLGGSIFRSDRVDTSAELALAGRYFDISYKYYSQELAPVWRYGQVALLQQNTALALNRWRLDRRTALLLIDWGYKEILPRPLEDVAWFQYATQVAPDLADTWYNWGLDAERNGDLVSALSRYQNASEAVFSGQVTRSEVLAKIGIAYRRIGNASLDKSLELLNQALNLNDFRSTAFVIDVHYERGEIYWEQGDWTKALEDYEFVVKLRPSHRWARLRHGYLIYLVTGNTTGAIDELQQVLNMWPSDKYKKWPLIMQGRIYEAEGFAEYALNAYRSASLIDHSDLEVVAGIERLSASNSQK